MPPRTWQSGNRIASYDLQPVSMRARSRQNAQHQVDGSHRKAGVQQVPLQGINGAERQLLQEDVSQQRNQLAFHYLHVTVVGGLFPRMLYVTQPVAQPLAHGQRFPGFPVDDFPDVLAVKQRIRP